MGKRGFEGGLRGKEPIRMSASCWEPAQPRVGRRLRCPCPALVNCEPATEHPEKSAGEKIKEKRHVFLLLESSNVFPGWF